MSPAWLDPEGERNVARYLGDRFGVPARALDAYRLYRRGEHVLAVGRDAAGACDALQWEAAGIKLVRVARSGGFRLTTRGAQVFGTWATRGVCDVTDEDLRALLVGQSLAWNGEGGAVILRWERCPVGLGLVRRGQLVSQLPRSFTENLRLAPEGAIL